MKYVFQFGIVWDHLPRLLEGAWLTLRLSLGAFALGFLLAVALAFLRTSGPRPVRAAVSGYVEFIRNTPFLVQLFIIYFSLPALGIRFDATTAALIGMSLNFSGYATEIIRSGIEAVPRSQIEAGQSLGFTRVQIYRQIIVFPALRTAYPALASQFVLLMLGSSIVSAISAEELTAVTNTLQSTTFRAFEFYFVATAMYLSMALGTRLLLHAIYWAMFERGRPAEQAWS
ncbi:MAG TPA: amino acid ABC transporter permease [Casimicrobiaceae bacterium]|nr:amino acid ABC transporter permease [Casimicrobiaceae bacterium]